MTPLCGPLPPARRSDGGQAEPDENPSQKLKKDQFPPGLLHVFLLLLSGVATPWAWRTGGLVQQEVWEQMPPSVQCDWWIKAAFQLLVTCEWLSWKGFAYQRSKFWALLVWEDFLLWNTVLTDSWVTQCYSSLTSHTCTLVKYWLKVSGGGSVWGKQREAELFTFCGRRCRVSKA